MKVKDVEYLTENIYIWEARKQQVNKHLSKAQAQRFQEIALEIKPDAHFQLVDCQSCIDALVLFVYKHYEASVKRKAKADEPKNRFKERLESFQELKNTINEKSKGSNTGV